jgi:hypothetical protein
MNEALGSGAYANVMTSLTDGTAGRLMPVGAFGLGAPTAFAGNIDNLSLNAKFALTSSTTGALPSGVSSFDGYILESFAWLGNSIRLQRLSRFGVSRTRSMEGGGWGGWQLQYDQSNIVGTVSQSAGVPTGAIIQHIANANGKATRFADGTQISWNDNSPITIDPSNFVGTPTSIDGNKLRIGKWI